MQPSTTITPEIEGEFLRLYGKEPRIFRAPGRINLIGEHTDYNEGFVMPVAIDFQVCVAISGRDDRKLRIRSTNFPDIVEIDLQTCVQPRHHWSDYVAGVAVALEQAGHSLKGADLLIHSDIPIGSGLSSSAAVEVAAGFALLENSGIPTQKLELAKLCRRAENEFVGARVGIMDQFISCFGRKDMALLLDCRSLDYQLLPLPACVRLVICNTMVKHNLAVGEYNRRREECEEAVRFLSRRLAIRTLRDLSVGELEQYATELPPTLYRRARHVIRENARVQSAFSQLQRGDFIAFGRLMGESHRSLRDDFEVSCPELDLMVELAERHPGVFGARMTGAGFGGCTVNLVASEAVEEFRQFVERHYEESTGHVPEVFVSSIADGATEVTE